MVVTIRDAIIAVLAFVLLVMLLNAGGCVRLIPVQFGADQPSAVVPAVYRPQVKGREQGHPQKGWHPTVDCKAMGGLRKINPSTGKPSCFVPE